MTDQFPSDEDLLQGRLDRTLTAGESARLDARLATDATLRARAAQLDALGEALASVKTSDPAPALAPRVMAQIHPGIESVSGRRASIAARQEAGMSQAGTAKKVVWGLAAAAAVVLGVWLVKGSPAAGGPTAGTVGAAKRYAAPQISDEDVKLDASLQTVQAFLDSEAFGRVMADPEAIALLGDPKVRAAIGARAASPGSTPSPTSNASIAAVMDDPSFVVLVTNPVFDASWRDAAHQVAEMNTAIAKSQLGGQNAAGLNKDLGKGLGADAAGLNKELGKGGLGADAAGLNKELGKDLGADAAGLNRELGKGLGADAAGLNKELGKGLGADAAGLNKELGKNLGADAAGLNRELGKGLGADAAGLNKQLSKGLGADAAGLNKELGKNLGADAAGLNRELGKGLGADAANLNKGLGKGLGSDAAGLNKELGQGLRQSNLQARLTAQLQTRLKSSLESGLKTRLNSDLNGRLGQKSSQ